jgi:hypothetical protein
MSVVDRLTLSRCCALFGGLSWACAAVMVIATSIILGCLASVPGVGTDTLAAGVAPTAMAATTDIAGHSIKTFAVATAAFGILAVGSVVAGLGLVMGRRVLQAGGKSSLLTAGLVSSTAYLAAVGGVFIRAVM